MPTLVTKARESGGTAEFLRSLAEQKRRAEDPQEQAPISDAVAETSEQPDQKPKETIKSVDVAGDDMFSAHDFDITIDLEVPPPTTTVSVTPKPIPQMKEGAPRRSLNLEDYKKRRGLI